MSRQKFNPNAKFESINAMQEYCAEFPKSLERMADVVHATLLRGDYSEAAAMCTALSEGSVPKRQWTNKQWRTVIPPGSRVCVRSVLHEGVAASTGFAPSDRWGDHSVYEAHHLRSHMTKQSLLLLRPMLPNLDDRTNSYTLNLQDLRYRTSLHGILIQCWTEEWGRYVDYLELAVDPEGKRVPLTGEASCES